MEINRDYRKKGIVPLYERYEGQTDPQTAQLIMDEDGKVEVGVSGEIGNSVSIDVWNGRMLTWRLPNYLSVQGIDALLDKVEPLLKELHRHHTVVWDGSNFIGQIDDEGERLSMRIEKIIDDFEAWRDPTDVVEIWDAVEYFQNSISELKAEYNVAENKAAYLTEIRDNAEAENVYLDRFDELIDQLEG